MKAQRLKKNVDTLLQAWATNDPASILSGMTLEQFRLAVAPALASRVKIDGIRQQSRSAIAEREAADRQANEDYLRVVNAIKGSEMHGENSAFYRALGYKTRNERRSGKTNKASSATANNKTNPVA